MFAKSRIEIEILENLRKPLTRKSTRKRIDNDFERVSFIYVLARLTKNRKRLVLLRWLKLCESRKIHCLTSEFHVEFHLKTDIARIAKDIDFSREINVEFTFQAVNFFIKYLYTSL